MDMPLHDKIKKENAIKWIEWFLYKRPYVSDYEAYQKFVGALHDTLDILKSINTEKVVDKNG